MAKISKRIVDAAHPTDKAYFVWDDTLKGFGLLVLPSGIKSYVFQYRTPEGRTRRATIGKHGTKTADQARDEAKAMERMVATGGDPLGDKKAKRESLTVEKLLGRYAKSARFAEKTEATRINELARIKWHLTPLLGSVFIHQLKPEDVRRAFADIRDGKTATTEKTKTRGKALVTGGEGVARMCIRNLRTALNWAVDEGLMDKNPAARIRIGTDGTRETILDSPEQYKRFFEAVDKLESTFEIPRNAANIFRIIALTGARRGEILRLRWRYVDLKKGVITIPPRAAGANKAGKRTGKPRIIGLPAAVQAILAAQPQGKPDDLVFPASRGGKELSLSKPWETVRAKAELPAGFGLHGFRHSLATQFAIAGAQAAELMTTLGHAQLSTVQKYLHWAQDARASLAERAAAHITAALEPKPAAEVVAIDGKGAKS